MEQLLCHLVGDYVLQNHWMAANKTKHMMVAVIHAAFYSLPFLLLVQHAWQWAVIFLTHAFIDHYRVARWWVDFWGVGVQGKVMPFFTKQEIPNAPDFLAVWLVILVDNTMHLTLNYLVLKYG